MKQLYKLDVKNYKILIACDILIVEDCPGSEKGTERGLLERDGTENSYQIICIIGKGLG